MPRSTPPLATIGYEGATQPDVLDRLKAARVELLIDVRAVAASRRAGFSKSLLAASLAAAGMEYLHLRDLGTPKAGRDAARAGRSAEMQRIFAAHMAEPPAQAAFAQAIALIGQRRCCLLCFEAEHERCHRAILATDFARTLRCEVVHL
jgi:uncharacterized protein (DUF488 family)